MTIATARERFRAFPLDGALLFFQPTTGLSVRVRNERTVALRRQAPRVVMFGITNRCNSSCSFCSRDLARESDWSVPTALEMLQGLASRGTLEIAFGGGEPFAFRGFAELIAELAASTALALHVTTNGTLLDAQRFAPFRDRFGQVRVSIYDDPRWRVAARTLADAGQLWGANVLVDVLRLETLPRLFAELAALGCHDVSVLRYVGGEPKLQLDLAGRRRLSELIQDAPLSCRVSVCFGAELPVPRLFEGVDGAGDCGAGYDFLTLTSDRRVQSCSFRDSSLPARTAEDVLAIWRSRQDTLARASRRLGCSRDASHHALPTVSSAEPRNELPKVWHAFSGNNSGECILVGKFASSEEAKRYLAELANGYEPDGDYSAEWNALFDAEQVTLARTRDGGKIWGQTPSSLVAVGRSVIALGYDAGDAFPELRALTWKRGGFVLPGGIHRHEPSALVVVIRGRDAADVRALAADAKRAPYACETYAHGALLFMHVPSATSGTDITFEQRVQHLEGLAGARPLGVEVYHSDWDEAAFIDAKQRLAVELPTSPRLQVMFHGMDSEAHAQRFVAQISEARAHEYKGCVLVEGISRRKRLAVLALRQGGSVIALDSLEVDAHGFFWHPVPPPQKGKKAPPAPSLEREELEGALQAALGTAVQLEPGAHWRPGWRARIRTADPAAALAALAGIADRLGTQINLWVSDAEGLAFALRRLIADVSAPEG